MNAPLLLAIQVTVLALAVGCGAQDEPESPRPETRPVVAEPGTLMSTLLPQLDDDLRSWMSELAEIAANGIGNRDTEWKIFHGCWDWHSAVHSHWTLIRYARATGDRRWDAKVRESLLRQGGLAAEAQLLRVHSAFEMPYGRAWFLRLVIDYELHFESRELRSLGNEVMASMIEHYREKPARATPRDREYANASWAFGQMLAYARHIGATETEGRLLAQIAEDFSAAAAEDVDFAEDSHPRAGFFSRFGNWISLRAAAAAPTDLAATLEPFASDGERFLLEPVAELHSDHHLGMNPSRAWALATLARETGDERYEGSWRAHVAAMKKAHTAAAGDYRAYDHWVPSFCMYALTEPLQAIPAAPR